MRAMVIGDMHDKQQTILPALKERAIAVMPDIIIIVGDHVDSFETEERQSIENLIYQRNWCCEMHYVHGIEVMNMIGNHDLMYLIGAFCSGTQTHLAIDIAEALRELPNTIAAFGRGSWLITHAGLNASWARMNMRTEALVSAEAMSADINEIFATCPRMLNTVGSARGGSELPSPVWADITEVAGNPIPGVNQIIGHTPVREITCELGPANEQIWCCDVFSTWEPGNVVPEQNPCLLVDFDTDDVEILTLPIEA